jgi:hypothetical protein
MTMKVYVLVYEGDALGVYIGENNLNQEQTT